MGVLFQIIGTAIICSLGINMGLIFAWPASIITLFGSNSTILNRPMTETEISLLGSLSSVGAIISTLIAGLLLDKLGRKKCSILINICMVFQRYPLPPRIPKKVILQRYLFELYIQLFWLLLTFSRRVEVVLTSIFISGIASAVILIASVYISEICQESIRGAMTAANMVSYGLGMLLSYALGGYLPYDIMLYVGLTQSSLGCGLLIFLSDSPLYLLQTGKEKEAIHAVAFFRHAKPTDKEVVEEIGIIKRALNPDLDDSTPEHETLQKDSKPAAKLSFWQFMKKSQSTRRALFVVLVAMTTSIFQGLVVVQIYVEVLFSQAVTSISPTVGSMLMAAIGVVAAVISGYLTDVLGRRPLMIYGSLASGIFCIILGTQLQFYWGPNWITPVFIYAFVVTYTIGAGTVPFVLLAELFLPEVKSIMSMLVMEWAWTCFFVILFIFNPLLKAFGWGPVFYIFTSICFITAVFCAIFLPETKGLSVNDIQELFLKKKQRRRSQFS